jgi:tRNA threonylcarbamoyladenosine biosynthesis protein TsaB
MMMPENTGLRVLALDTSSPRGSVALLQGREAVAELRLKSLRTHSATLLRSVEFLLDQVGWALRDLNLVAAGMGPGSFTGIRIGVATALGLAQSLRIPFAGISGLDALASQTGIPDGRIFAIMDAQRSQLYCAEYVSVKGRLRRVGKPSLQYPIDLEFRLRKRQLYIAADRSLRCLENLTRSENSWPRVREADLYVASAIGRLAQERKRSWKVGERLVAEPAYIRPPDALRPKAKR